MSASLTHFKPYRSKSCNLVTLNQKGNAALLMRFCRCEIDANTEANEQLKQLCYSGGNRNSMQFANNHRSAAEMRSDYWIHIPLEITH